jgi:hypothetical protein
MHDGSRQDRAAEGAAPVRSQRERVSRIASAPSMPKFDERRQVHQLVIERGDNALIASAQPHGSLGDRIEHRLHVRRRAC